MNLKFFELPFWGAYTVLQKEKERQKEKFNTEKWQLKCLQNVLSLHDHDS